MAMQVVVCLNALRWHLTKIWGGLACSSPSHSRVSVMPLWEFRMQWRGGWCCCEYSCSWGFSCAM